MWASQAVRLTLGQLCCTLVLRQRGQDKSFSQEGPQGKNEVNICPGAVAKVF